MSLSKLSLYNFRSYTEQEFTFSDHVTMIVGPNGVGKTNILEAIYVLLQGKSFRDSDEQLLQYDQQWWKVIGLFDDEERELRFQPTQISPKQLLINGVTKGRFTYKQQQPVVLFEPDDLLLIHGSPSARRGYLDLLLTNLSLPYRTILAKYERALLQRNNVLKRGGSLAHVRDAVFVWDIALSEYGAEIVKQRFELVQMLNEKLSEYYSLIATTPHNLSIHYVPPTKRGSQGLAELLHHSLEKDMARGFTGVGPHRDDIDFLLDSKNAKQTASRGEVRTIVLALKYAELALLTEQYGASPPFLLDDVFSELDTSRQKALLTHTKDVQKIITTTHQLSAKNVTIIKL